MTPLKRFQQIAREKPDLPIEQLANAFNVAISRDRESAEKTFIALSRAREQHIEEISNL